MNKVITWEKVGDNPISFKIEYKLDNSSTWLLFSTVAGNIRIETITGLDDNKLYNFRVISVCNGSENPSDVKTDATLRCLVANVTYGDTFIDVDAYGITGITKYQFLLYNSSDEIVRDYSLDGPFTTGDTYTHGFIGLTPDTSYKWKLVPYINTYFKDTCSGGIIKTLQACNAATYISSSLEMISPVSICYSDSFYLPTSELNIVNSYSYDNASIITHNTSSYTIPLKTKNIPYVGRNYKFFIAEPITEPIKTQYTIIDSSVTGTIIGSNIFESVYVLGKFRVYKGYDAIYPTLINSDIILSV